MRILIPGGAGYIGSILTPLLLQRGFSVTVIDNLMYKQVCLTECFRLPHFKFIRGDVTDFSLMETLLPQADMIIPLAALVGAPICAERPSYATLLNYTFIKWLADKIQDGQKIIFPNTNSGYGKSRPGEVCDEKTPLHPLSLYGKLKVEGEKLLLQSGKAVSLRLATVFGLSPRMRLDLLVNDLTYRACTDKFALLFEENFVRNYIHIQDVARTFLFVLDHFEDMVGHAFNVGLSSANLSKKELCQLIQKQVPDFYFQCAPIGKDPDQRDYHISNAKLEAMGWHPLYSLEDGIKELVSAYPMFRSSSFSN